MACFKAGILKEKRDEIRDCDYGQDTGFGDFNKRESGNVALKKPRFGNSETETCKENQAVILAHLIKVGNSRTMT